MTPSATPSATSPAADTARPLSPFPGTLRAPAWQRAIQAWLHAEVWPQALALLAARWVLFHAFFLSGLTKVRDWDSTLFLFQEEYHVPLLPPELAAWMGTGGELVFSSLLLVGLLTRPAALGLFVVNAMAVISYPDLAPAALKDHHLWGALAVALAVFGAGRLSVDAPLWRRLARRP